MGINTYWFPFQFSIFSILKFLTIICAFPHPQWTSFHPRVDTGPGMWATGSERSQTWALPCGAHGLQGSQVYLQNQSDKGRWQWTLSQKFMEPGLFESRKHQEGGERRDSSKLSNPRNASKSWACIWCVLWGTIWGNPSCVSKTKQLSPWFCTSVPLLGISLNVECHLPSVNLHFLNP